ncbi:MAG: MBL fold metallo-hydrolase [Prevotellaceae bacterium]|jgi:L-ascorbate metabolism protein UlaG (beta-lactamase superfamily)|nr:MBL fold metallo-hydrolase [Prevotellaceae bacterium]
MKHFICLLMLTLTILALIALSCSPVRFGRLPQGERKERVMRSPNYRNGRFQNLPVAPQLAAPLPDTTSTASREQKPRSKLAMMWRWLFERPDSIRPAEPIPTKPFDLLSLDPNEDVLVWFGHSSYFLQLGGRRVLVDPVFSKSGAPVSFVNKAFEGTRICSAADMPPIDYLIITHDHWDHLDYPTVKALRPKVRKVLCPLGVGEHFERWEFDPSRIVELDWHDVVQPDSDVVLVCLPAHHFSGRSFVRNPSLWASFLLQIAGLKIFIGGDSGYAPYFADIGQTYGPIDLAMIENGQYNLSWPDIHMMPDETLQAGRDLQARVVMPVHNSKFALSIHRWDEPLNRVTALHSGTDFNLITPMIGEQISLRECGSYVSKTWWKN